ncbi:MAG: FlgD immunoglobulin-like domain containing protein [Candidatus Krumholzibacteriia bacterium]
MSAMRGASPGARVLLPAWIEDPARCAAGGEIAYTLSARRAGDWVLIAQQTVSLATPPVALRLLGASPNPFNPRTTVRFELPQAQAVSLRVFDGRGRQVRALFTGTLGAGPHDLTWDGRDDRGAVLASGTYLFQLRTADGLAQTAKAVLLK